MEGHEHRVFLIGRGIQGARLVDALLKMLGDMWTLPQQRQQESGSPRSQSCTSIDGAGEPIPKPEVILFSTSVLSPASCGRNERVKDQLELLRVQIAALVPSVTNTPVISSSEMASAGTGHCDSIPLL
ncbi:hypothetical protein [Neorhizobium galegae]|uniref:hypothetical protein n=1 Tax=Neorhizobium galegae TaxID=399 RepID=UPI00127F65C7|nr:hypothetical protein [Neorhizobium galegae]KAA9382474.1 hypothetical protein F4V88_30895 [Neorhizobium galegae]MCM2501333.1 hypothetical protein [Neorhizobium galegae]MCQ1775210.1 hypothetical protein [Neorhizobium galegae]MCQ1799571.1 hypothetical protein [Neorhizobium galegae]